MTALGDGPAAWAPDRALELVALGIFVLALTHTFAARQLERLGHRYPRHAGLSVDVLAMVRSSRAALPWLQRSGAAGGANIVHISSIAAFRPTTRTPAYAAVKAAMNSYTGSQAALLSRQGIRVNAIAPGSIEFPGGVWDQRKTDNPTLYERTLKSIPFGRFGTPDEVAEAALFLASPHARWITAQVLVVDGGQLLGA